MYKVEINSVIGNTSFSVNKVEFDSRLVSDSDMYVAIAGVNVDGHDFISQAIKNGAKCIVCEKIPIQIDDEIVYVNVKSSRKALAIISSNYCDNPSSKLNLIGITGTNGKTTISTLLYDLYRNLGIKSGLISTVKISVGDNDYKAKQTTPDSLSINSYLNEMVKSEVRYCFMEVSSHAVHQKRISGLRFKGALFTNITHDHLDYHKTFDNYIKAKKAFFDDLTNQAFSLINQDDIHAEIMVQNTKSTPYTFALKQDADFRAKILENHFQGLNLVVDGNELWSKLIGHFNAYNLLATYATAILLNQDKLEVLTMLSNLNPPAGRFQYLRTDNGIVGIVDYAHTPDALKNVLNTINDIRGGNEKVITVIGCGGDRDKDKRPVMADIATKHSDKVLLTSDNPRTEDPTQIIKDMEAGVDKTLLKKTLSITDRREAIKAAAAMAESGDIILVAGKGHETYQEINRVRSDFDDMLILTEMLKLVN